MIKRIIFVLVLLLASNITFAASNDWLLGDWQMTYDPDGDSKDVLSFSKGGEFVTTEASSGRKIKGMYVLKSDRVDVSLIHQGQIFLRLRITYDNDKNKLYYNPDNTDDPAYYTKLQ
jgi:hypothetical protein